MLRSVRAAFSLILAAGILSCATVKQPPSGPKQKTATMGIAPDEPVVAQAVMPPGFEPIPFRPPLWLDNGQAIGILGTMRGRAILAEYPRSGFQEPRLLAADQMPGAPDATLADVALSPNHSSFAIAFARAGTNSLEIVRRDLAGNEVEALFSLKGKFQSISLGWPDDKTVALAVIESSVPVSTESPSPTATPFPTDTPSADATPTPAVTPTPVATPMPASTLYLIPPDGSGTAQKLELKCALTAMNWSPKGTYAVSQGDAGTAPSIFDRKNKSCTTMNVPGPIHVIEWAPADGKFLYTGPTPSGPIATFQFDIATGEPRLMALSSSAAAYVGINSVLALGNRELTLRRLQERSGGLTVAEVALIDPTQINIRIETLGIQTLPDMLVSSLMTYSDASQTAAIELYAPNGVEALRHIIAYSVTTGRAALLASGPAAGIALMSWSPDGKLLALLDGDSRASTLTLIAPAIPKHGTAPPPPALNVPPLLAPSIPPGL